MALSPTRPPVFGIVALAAGASVVWMWGLQPLPSQHTDRRSVVLAAIAFALAEIAVVHVQMRREAHSFSLSEVPLIAVTILVAPAQAVAAAVLGHAVALVLHRRQRAFKLLFNLSRAATEVAICVGFVRALAGAQPTTVASRPLIAAFLGAVAASTVGCLLVSAVVAAAEGSMPLAVLRSNVVTSVTGAAFVGSLGLLSVVVVRFDPHISWVLALPMVGGYLLYRALVQAQRQAETLRFLHDAGKLLHESKRVEGALEGFLERVRSELHGDVVELAFVMGSDDEMLRGSSTTGGTRLWSEPNDGGLLAILMADGSGSADPGPPSAALAEWFGRGRASEQLVAVLATESRRVGALLVGSPSGDKGRLTGFDTETGRLLGTLSQSLTFALQNGTLERSLRQLRVVERELEHKAYHDSLTGLANRDRFMQCLSDAGDALRSAHRRFAVLLCDLDDFKAVNDTLGHDAGDALLIEVARRLRAVLAEHDIAARLGGDEFAVIAAGWTEPAEVEELAQEIVRSLRAPIEIGGRTVSMSVSVGISLGRADAGLAEMVKAADVAMYDAKAGGKSRAVVSGRRSEHGPPTLRELSEDREHAQAPGMTPPVPAAGGRSQRV